ncbi:amidohydrolase family protein [Mycobacterium sp.]|uniref:amidohydrolase family protein n=1 Tax=Mycobacterium sp. TaxID=1785 RepID=UPI003D101BB3
MTELITDVHTHPLLAEYKRILTGDADAIAAEGVALPPWNLVLHLENMDEHGIGAGILSLPGMTNVLVGKDASANARGLNEELAAVVSQHPDRLGAFAVVPMHDIDAALIETAYALDDLNLDGVCVGPQFAGTYLGDDYYDPWFEELNRRGATLFVHPDAPPGFSVETSKMNVSVVEFMFETTRMVATMVLSGAKRRFARVNIIATHGGGTIPYLATRISLAGSMPWGYRGGPKLDAADILTGLASFYFDLTAATAPAALDGLHALVPPTQLLMGFDYPLMPPQTIEPAKKTFELYSGFDDNEKALIISGNAHRLFPRFA